MVDNIISTNNTTQISLAGTDSYLLLPDVAHTNSGNVIRKSAGDAYSIGVYGFMSSINSTTISVVNSTADGNTLNIGADGIVTTSARAAFTISLAGDNTSINNAGAITGVGALLMTGDGYDLINTGTISGDVIVNGNFAAVQSSAAPDTQISNSGTIAGNLGMVARSDVQILNSGTIQGANQGVLINAGSTIDLAVIVNTGTIMAGTNAIESTFFAVDLTNLGEITGDVLLDIRNDVIENSGTIAGDVILDGGTDRFQNFGDGMITGTVFGGDGDDTLLGGEADDIFNGGDNSDIMAGNSGEDTLNGSGGNDFIFGGADDDQLNGGADNDVLRGNSGDDELIGGGGADKLFGGTGDDEIIGGAARDVMRGNGGSDTFIFTATTDSTLAAADRIRDFQSGEDLIDISEIESFTFIGSASFSGTGAEVRFQTVSNGLRFEMDVNGNGTADMRVNMNNVSTMTEADFIL